MNLTSPESFLFTQSQRDKKRKPFSGTIEVAGKSIQTNDIIDITKQNGNIVRYRVTDIILDDEQPARLALTPLRGGKNTHIDLDTLGTKQLFSVLTEKQKLAVAEKEIQELNTSVMQNTDISQLNQAAMAEAEIAAMQTTETPMAQVKQIERELDTYVSLHQQLRAQEESHIKQVQDKIARILSAHESSMTAKGFREMTPADKRNLFSEPIPAPLSHPETTEHPPVNQMSQNNTQTQPAPSFLRNITSGIRNLFQKKPELPTGANLPRTIYTEHATSLTQSRFTPPPGFETPTLQSIKETISGTKRTLYETDPEMVAQTKRDANKAAEQMTQNTQRSTMIDAGYADRYAAYQKDRDTAPTPSFFGNIRKLFGRLFDGQPEVQTGASLSRTVYRPDADPKSPPPDNVIPFPQPKKRKPQDIDSGMLEAAE